MSTTVEYTTHIYSFPFGYDCSTELKTYKWKLWAQLCVWYTNLVPTFALGIGTVTQQAEIVEELNAVP